MCSRPFRNRFIALFIALKLAATCTMRPPLFAVTIFKGAAGGMLPDTQEEFDVVQSSVGELLKGWLYLHFREYFTL